MKTQEPAASVLVSGLVLCLVSSFVAGLASAFAGGTNQYGESTGSSPALMFIAAVLGFVGIVLVLLGVHRLATVIDELGRVVLQRPERRDYARIDRPGMVPDHRPHASEPGAAPAAENPSAVETPVALRSPSDVDGLAQLLSDPEIRRVAWARRRLYGRNVCISYLKRMALELGLGDISVTDEDVDALRDVQ